MEARNANQAQGAARGGLSELKVAISVLAAMVGFAAGYITTVEGQKEASANAVDVFIFSLLTSISSAVAARAFPIFEDISLLCIMLASSSLADILLLSRHHPWYFVYIPTIFTAVLLLINSISLTNLFTGAFDLLARLSRFIHVQAHKLWMYMYAWLIPEN